jgi:adenine-specific DNA-methyltransferase
MGLFVEAEVRGSASSALANESGENDALQIRAARQFVRQCVRAFWNERTGGAALRGENGAMIDGYSDDVAAVIDHVRALPLAAASYHLSGIYADCLPRKFRSSRGVYYTPPILADRLLDLLEESGARWSKHRVLDPACGGGAFLGSVVSRMVRELESTGVKGRRIVDAVTRNIRGIEIDPFSAWMTEVFVELALWPYLRETGERLPSIVFNRDALTLPVDWYARTDVIVGNPPYGRIALDPEIRRNFARSIWGHANIYGVFTELALRLTRRGGVVGYVTPTSFLGGEYFKALRGLLITDAAPITMDFVEGRSGVFDTVLQETVLIVLRRGNASGRVRVRLNRSDLDSPRSYIRDAGDHALPRSSGKPWLLPRAVADVALVRAAATSPFTLRDAGVVVSTGPLVWNRFKPFLHSEQSADSLPIVWAESVLPTGEFELSARRRGHLPFLRIQPGKHHLVTNEPCVLLQRTTAKEQRRRLIAAHLPSDVVARFGGVVIENHLNVVRIATDSAPGLSTRVLLAFLRSEVADRLFRSMSGSVAVSAYEIESLPLPYLGLLDEIGASLDSGCTPAEIDGVIYDAYFKKPTPASTEPA